MEYLEVPWIFLGPSSSGKLTQARQFISRAHKTTLTYPLEERKFSVGDGYEARVYASPYHFEIDIPNLSMQDKQIIGDLLVTFFSSADVLTCLKASSRKLVILRRAHVLSLPAAMRVRAILQQYVLPACSGANLWITAREMTGPIAYLSDMFVVYRVPRMTLSAWQSLDVPEPLKTEIAYDRCNGSVQRIKDVLQFFPDGNVPEWPPRIQDFYDTMIRNLIKAARYTTPPSLDIVMSVRRYIYQALSLCQKETDILDSMAAAVQNNAALLEPDVFFKVFEVLSFSEPHTSYRTPLSLEAALLFIYDTVKQHTKTPVVRSVEDGGSLITDGGSSAAIPTNSFTSPSDSYTGYGSSSSSSSAIVSSKPTVKRRTSPRKKVSRAKNMG
jgi:hypothetical protein